MNKRGCIVTGASRGIGLAVARRFIRGGARVLLVARHAAGLDAARATLGDGPVTALEADISTPDGVARVLETAQREFGRVDVLVNNAGAAPLSPIEEVTDAEFRELLATNVESVFRLTRGIWPILKKQGGGVIVNISSVGSVDPFPGFSVYGATKAWVNLFTKATAAEGRAHGIRAFAVAPGAVETQLLRSRFPDLPPASVLQPDDVAALVEAVCEPGLRYSSGQTIFLQR